MAHRVSTACCACGIKAEPGRKHYVSRAGHIICAPCLLDMLRLGTEGIDEDDDDDDEDDEDEDDDE